MVLTRSGSRRDDSFMMGGDAAGIIDLDAVPANKRHMLLGDPGNPVPLIEFRLPKREVSTQKRRHRKK